MAESRQGWSAEEIARAMAMMVFDRHALVLVPNCYWTGDECDLLVVRTDLRLVDIEIKVSRSDLRRDASKAKWVELAAFTGGQWKRDEVPRSHPRKVWKHYYALPRDIWTDELASCISPASGVITMSRRSSGEVYAHVRRQAKPAPDPHRLTLPEVIDIARVCHVRYWDRFGKLRQ
jgi:hypothetical protein